MTTASVAPATFAWLVRHELRLARRDAGGSKWRTIVVLAVLMLLPVLGGVAMAWQVRGAAAVPTAQLGMIAAINLGLLLLMLSGACVYVLRNFHDRADLDLLLSAPIAPWRVLAAKSVAVQASVALPLLVIASPFLLASAALGHVGWLGGIVMIAATAVMATSLAFVIAGGLFRSLGARRARIVIQIGGGLFAAAVAIGGQAPNFAPQAFRRFIHRFDAVPPPPFDWPARAFFGAPLPLLAMVALAAAAALAAARLAAHNMAQAAPVPARAARVRPGAVQFRGGAMRGLLVKEARLLWRDPELLSAMALQMAYMIPAFGLIFSDGGVSTARLAAACVLFAGLLASSLGWLTICGEDAPDLLASAPVPGALVASAKLLAACAPALAIVAVPLLVVATRDAVAAVLAALMCGVAAVASAQQQAWAGDPKPRRTFRFRQKGSLLLAVSEYAMAGGWAGATSLMVQGSLWAAAPAGLAVAVLAASRRRA